MASAAASAAGAGLRNELGPRARCLSPSDFGFHNAIRRASGELCFIDFEYAGQDDPAKMACDFLCQPEVPVPDACRERFLDAALAAEAAADAVDPIEDIQSDAEYRRDLVRTITRRALERAVA